MRTWFVRGHRRGTSSNRLTRQRGFSSSSARRFAGIEPLERRWLANLTGGGWNQLYFQGRLTPQAQQHFFHELQVNSPYAQKEPFWTEEEIGALEERLRDLQQTHPIGSKGFTKAGIRKMISRLHEELALSEASENARRADSD